MCKELFTLGPIAIHSFGTLIAVGVAAAVIIAMFRANKFGLDKELVLDMGILSLVGGFLGAKLLYLLLEIRNITADNFKDKLTSGFVLYGGIIGGALCVIVYCLIKKADIFKYADLILPSVAIAQGFGRIGCFLAGCCYGRETDSILGVVFPADAMAPSGVKLLPTQLFSSAGDFLLAFVLIILAGKIKKDGYITGIYLLLYGIGRFIVEIFRNDPRGNIGLLSTSQFISIILVIISIIIFAAAKRKSKNSIK